MTSSSPPKSATMVDRAIGRRIATLRAARKMSQTSLAQGLGLSFQQVQKYEQGRTRISAGRLQLIADLLEVPIEMLFGEPPASIGDRSTRVALGDPDVVELALVFAKIPDAATRESLLTIVKRAALLHGG